jgi:hypothetical protein
MASLVLLSGCASAPPQRVVYVAQPVRPYSPPPQVVTSVYDEPALSQPEPIAVRWAPPPMLVEIPPPAPYDGAVWIGGYWVWNGNWTWAHGRWADVPRPRYYWVHPYYEYRDHAVVFISGYWSAPTAVFVPPPPRLHIDFASVSIGVRPGPAPIGPLGVFVPAPPGSRPGIIIPAPIGTSPAVVTSAPPVVNVGMRIQNNINSNNTTNVTNINNVRSVTNITNVTIVAPATATASGQAVRTSVPAQAHLAAAMHSVVNAPAPKPGPVHAASGSAADGNAAQISSPAARFEAAPSPVHPATGAPLARPEVHAAGLASPAHPAMQPDDTRQRPMPRDPSWREEHGGATMSPDSHAVGANGGQQKRQTEARARPAPKQVKPPAKEGHQQKKNAGIDKQAGENR